MKTIDIKEKRDRKSNRNIKYIAVLLGGIAILATAIMGPQLLFRIQDDYRMGRTWQGKRNSLDMATLNSSYGTLRDRMEALSNGIAQGEEYYATGTECRVTEEVYSIIEELVTSQAPFWVMVEQGVIPRSVGEELWIMGDAGEKWNVEKWKKYVIYNDSFEEGIASVAVMAWYIELKIFDDYRIKLLTDTETNTIYYMQCINESDSIIYTDKIQMYVDVSFWNDYYQADYMEAEDQKRVIYNGNERNTEIGYDMSYYYKYLSWELCLRQLDNKKNFKMFYTGIKEIGDLILEFQ